MTQEQKFSILIPTYRNPDKIKICLRAIDAQSYKTLEVIVLYFAADRETEEVLGELRKKMSITITPVPLQEMSKMSAVLNVGIRKAHGDVICFLDEDVVPERKWLTKMVRHFSNSDIAACGGKDIITFKGRRKKFKETDEVGILKWKGYIVGNQHIGSAKKDVMFLKGCNMAVRRQYLKQLDENLIGLIRWEQDIFFPIMKSGMRIIYDPGIVVKHRKDTLSFPKPISAYWYGHNTVYLFMKYLRGMDRLLALLFYWFVGDASSPGLARFSFWLLDRGDLALCAFSSAQIGKIKGMLLSTKIVKREM